ncbi:MAG: GAF domain-containing protein [Dissulfuribacterales bacterium]
MKKDQTLTIDLIDAICLEEYMQKQPELRSIYEDVRALYAGEWPGYEACDLPYHTFEHVQDTALAAARMMAGWNRYHADKKFPVSYFVMGIIATLFHDAGYLKDKGDLQGTGAKHTYIHVQRSVKILSDYLQDKDWSEGEIEVIAAMIQATEFYGTVDIDPVLKEDNLLFFLTQLIITADIMAQIADPFYLERLPLLYAEFLEAYESVGKDILIENGVKVYNSIHEFFDATSDFIVNTIMPKLDEIGHMYDYLSVFFGTDRNPYLEIVVTNLNRIHDKQVAVVSKQDRIEVDAAGARAGKMLLCHQAMAKELPEMLRQLEVRTTGHVVNNLLVRLHDMNQVDAIMLYLERMLPGKLMAQLSKNDMIFFLRISLLLLATKLHTNVLQESLRIMCEHLRVESASILVADCDKSALRIIVSVGPKEEELLNKTVPWDKGMSGWVYQHGQCGVVNDATYDNRFYREMDKDAAYSTKSILAVPLIMDGVIVGVVELINKKGLFEQRDMACATCYSHLAAAFLDTLFWLCKDVLH